MNVCGPSLMTGKGGQIRTTWTPIVVPLTEITVPEPGVPAASMKYSAPEMFLLSVMVMLNRRRSGGQAVVGDAVKTVTTGGSYPS